MIKDFKILDKYIIKQIVETFLISLVIFTSLIFATDAFITIVRQITEYGIPLHIAALLVILKLPSMLILTIPMGMLLATLLTVNKMNNNLEITILKACGVGVDRISKPIFVCAIIASLLGFTINEIIAPTASLLAKNVTIMSIIQKNVPNGKQNFLYKEMNKDTHMLKRFIHIASVNKNKFKNITVIDTTKNNSVQVVYAKDGYTQKDGWNLTNGVVYTISLSGKILNSASFEKLSFDDTKNIINKINEVNVNELNYFDLKKYLKKEKENIKDIKEEITKKTEDKDIELNKNENIILEEKEEIIKKIEAENIPLNEKKEKILKYNYIFSLINEKKEKLSKYKELNILANEKLALPFTSIVFALIAIPLSITGPRARFNRGLLFSIGVLFIFYFLRAVSLSLGQKEILPFCIAAWLPNIILSIAGYILYKRNVENI